MNSVRSVCVVDDDAAVRSALARMLRVAGYEVQTFADADAFLEDDDRSRASCLILDVRMPGMDGIELHRHLIAHRINTPVIFLTAHGDVARAQPCPACERPESGSSLANDRRLPERRRHRQTFAPRNPPRATSEPARSAQRHRRPPRTPIEPSSWINFLEASRLHEPPARLAM